MKEVNLTVARKDERWLSLKDVDSHASVDKVKIEAHLLRLRTNEKINITKDRFSLGKGETVDYKIEGNNAISREHVVIIREGREFYVEELGSLNHTYLRGTEIIEKTPVLNGDTLKIADEEFLFVIVEDKYEKQR